MQALIYLYQRSFYNRAKKALHKPITYIYIVGIIAYASMMLWAFTKAFGEWKMDSPEGLASILAVVTFLLVPGNIIAYIRRKGVVFLKSDVHFVFPGPLSPKLVLLYAQVKQFLISLILGMITVVAGSNIFKISIGKMILYFLLCCLVENIIEASVMILTYGNERFSEAVMKGICISMFVLIGVFLLFAFIAFKNTEFSVAGLMGYLQKPFVLLFPLLGWNISLIYLIIYGPTVLNVTGSILYLASAVVLPILAVKMKCTGQYYEDAMKFADDYAEARKRKGRGEVSFSFAKPKYGKAEVQYKGSYAKAIFYRQLLEYKKSKTFLFDGKSLICLAVGIGFPLLAVNEQMGIMRSFVLPLVMAYIVLVFSGMPGKWGKELRMFYTFLLPDTAFRKMYYATLLEHIKAFINALMLTIPMVIIMKIPFLQAILCILLFVCMEACRLYLFVIAEGLLGNLLGDVGKQLLKMLFFSAIIGISALAAFIGYFIAGLEVAFFVMLIALVFQTAGCMLIASLTFEKMETIS